jgi:hypothetical protein
LVKKSKPLNVIRENKIDDGAEIHKTQKENVWAKYKRFEYYT